MISFVGAKEKHRDNIFSISLPVILIFALYLAFSVDCFNVIFYKSAGENGLISKVSRGLLEALLVFILIRKKLFTPLYIMCFFSIASLLGLMINLIYWPDGISSFAEIVSNVVIVNKFFLIFLLIYVINAFSIEHDFSKRLYRFFEISFLVYVVSILAGLTFNIEIFESYIGKSRFGYKGLIVTQNEAVGLFLIGLFYFYVKFKQFHQAKDIVTVYILFACGFLVGSKACMVFLTVAFVGFHFTLIKNKKFIYLLILVIVPAIIVLDWNALISKFNNTARYILYFYNRGDSLVSIVLTGRNWRLESLFNSIFYTENYGWHSFLVGGFNFLRLGTEMDFFDVLTLFGLFGLIYYILYVKALLNLSGGGRYILYFLCLFLTASTFGGHLIYNAVIPIYLVIMCLRMRDYSIDYLRFQ